MMSKEKSDLFAAVIHSNKGILYKVANSYCPNAEDRKDLVQEIIFQLWRSFDTYSGQYKYSTWMYRIALNVAISFYRKERSRATISNPFTEELFHFSEEPGTNKTEENITLLHQFILELKELDKALMLLYLEEKSYKEISEILGITETNVATKIGRIKKILKQKFSLINT